MCLAASQHERVGVRLTAAEQKLAEELVAIFLRGVAAGGAEELDLREGRDRRVGASLQVAATAPPSG